MKTTHKTGFTLIELLVVISIIGMLMGLLLPAVQSAREAARRMECLNNQKQLSLAVIGYEGAQKELPPFRKNLFVSDPTDTNFQTDSQMNWIILILPYLEENALYGRFYERSISTVPDLKTLKCPSSSRDFTAVASGSSPTSYVLNCGPQNLKDGTDIYDTGTFYYEPAVSMAGDKAAYTVGKDMGIAFDHIGFRGGALCKTTTNLDFISSADGTTKTILLTENEDGGQWITGIASGGVTSGREYDIGFTLPWDSTTAPSMNFTNLYLTDVTADFPRPARINIGKGLAGTSGYTTELQRYRFARPSSNHTGIIVVALCDGSVQTLSNSVDANVYTWLCMPKSGQTVSLP